MRNMAEDSCSHLNAITKVKHPTRRKCEECVKIGASLETRSNQSSVDQRIELSREAATKLHASKLNIRQLATRYDLPLQPGIIIDQTPQPGEEVVYGYPIGVTILKADSYRHHP